MDIVEFLNNGNNKIYLIVIIIFLIVSIIIFRKKNRTCNNETCNNLVTLDDWILVSETDKQATVSKKCNNIKPNIDGCSQIKSDVLNKSLNWTDIKCNKPCGSDSKGNKIVNIDGKDIISKNSYPCNTELCDSMVTFSPWILSSEDINTGTITRVCQNKDPKRDACSLIPEDNIKKTFNWTTNLGCDKPCGNNGVTKKSFTYNQQEFISNNSYPCNRIDCTSIVTFGNWTKIAENDSNVTLGRTCNNNDNKNDACSLISTSEIKQVIDWNGMNNCTQVCDGGKQNKVTSFKNNIYTSNAKYDCNTTPCSTLVTLGDWKLISETDTYATISRTCTNKDPSKDACSLISITDLSKNINWDGFNTCDKPCDGGKRNKTVKFNNNIFTSKTKYDCNTEPCNTLVTFTNWKLDSETDSTATITRTCNNIDPNKNACSLIPISDLTKNINWNDFNSCNKPCNTGNRNKTVTFGNYIFTSNKRYDCNTESCYSLVNFGNWNKTNEDLSSATISRACININPSRNACSLIPNNDVTKNVSWIGTNTCSKPCNGGKNNKIATYIDPSSNQTINLVSNNLYDCNTESCNTLVNFSDWSKINEDLSSAIISRSCINLDPSRNACSLIPNNLTSKNIPWNSNSNCSKPCNGGKNNKITTYIDPSSNQIMNLVSDNKYDCNTESCYSLVNFGNWNKTNEDLSSATISRACININPSRNACALIPNNDTNKNISWIGTNTCSKPCNGGKYNKVASYIDPSSNQTMNLVSDNFYDCNNESCYSLVNFSNWNKVSEDLSSATISRSCINKDLSRNACSLIPNNETNKNISWIGTNTCSKPCNGGKNNKVAFYIDPSSNQTMNLVSDNLYDCNNESCYSLVNFSDWNKINEDLSSATISRSCINKDLSRNACSLIPNNETNKNISWIGTNTCSKPCNGGKNNKVASYIDPSTNQIMNLVSDNFYDCNNESCYSLVNFSDWNKINEDLSSATINRSCSNINPSRDACSLIPTNDTNKNISWMGTNTCSKLCDGGKNNKIATYIDPSSNQIMNLVSDNSYDCNSESCYSLVNFSDWSKINEDLSSATINRICYNINSSRDACSLIPNNDTNKNISWMGTNTCSKPCDGGKNNKIATYIDPSSNQTMNLVSDNSYDCNTESCYSLVNFSDWNKTNEDLSSATINRTCNNINPSRDACSLIPNNDTNKNILWSNSSSCSKSCGGGIFNKSVSYTDPNNNQTTIFTSKDLSCNTQSCSILLQQTKLLPGQFITSSNNQYRLIYQTNGNLVLQRLSNNTTIWSSQKTISNPGILIMQNDGNLVTYDSNYSSYWSSNTGGRSDQSYYLILQDNSNLVIYNKDNVAIWTSQKLPIKPFKNLSITDKYIHVIDNSSNIFFKDLSTNIWYQKYGTAKKLATNGNNICIIGSDNKLYISNNLDIADNDFKVINIQNTSNIKDLDIDGNNICVINNNNRILCSTNLGVSFVDIGSPTGTSTTNQIDKISVNNNRVFIVNTNREIWFSNITSASWTKKSGSVKSISASGTRACAVGTDNHYYCTNNNTNTANDWSKRRDNVNSDNISVNNNRTCIVGSDNNIYCNNDISVNNSNAWYTNN